MADGEAISSVRAQLLRDRQALLDLSTRNRLLNVPLNTTRVRTIQIVDEKAAEVFRLLTEGRAFTFLPGRQLGEVERAELHPEDRGTGGIPQPDDSDGVDERGVAKRHTDLFLQTRLTSEGLHKRLFDIWYDSRTLEEEQGVIRTLWGLQRAGSRIRGAVQRAADLALRRSLVVGGEFLSLSGQPVAARNRTWVNSVTLRKPEYLPPNEIDVALMQVIEDNLGATADELATAAARIFGFQSTSGQLRTIFDSRVQTLVTNGRLVCRDSIYISPS